VQGVLTAEAAVLVHFKSVGIVLLVFLRVVVSLLTLTACESDLYSHIRHLLINSGLLPCEIVPPSKRTPSLITFALRTPYNESPSFRDYGAQKKNPPNEVMLV